MSPVLNLEPKHLFLVSFDDQKVDFRLIILVLLLKFSNQLKLLFVKVFLFLRTYDAVDFL